MRTMTALLFPILMLGLSVTHAEQVLTAPEIKLLNIGSKSLTLRATDNNSSVTQVQVYIQRSDEQDKTLISNASEHVFYTYSGLLPHQDYTISAQACISAICSAFSTIQATMLPEVPDSQVQNLNISATSTSLTFQFSDPLRINHKEGITGFDIELVRYQGSTSRNNCFNDQHIKTVTGYQHHFSNLNEEQDYLLCIRARNKQGPATLSNAILAKKVTTLAGIPQQAPIISRIYANRTLTAISWKPLSKEQAKGTATGHTIRYRLSNIESEKKVDWQQYQIPGSLTSLALITGLDHDGLYEFSIRAETNAGNGPWSQIE